MSGIRRWQTVRVCGAGPFSSLGVEGPRDIGGMQGLAVDGPVSMVPLQAQGPSLLFIRPATINYSRNCFIGVPSFLDLSSNKIIY